MEIVFRKYDWAMKLGFVALCAILLAVMVSGLLGVLLAPYRVPDIDLTVKEGKGNTVVAEELPSPNVMSRVINERCLFGGCPAPEGPKPCEPACQETEQCEDGVCVAKPPPVEEVVDGVPVLSNLGAKVLGIMVARNPRFSTVLLKEPSAKVSTLLGIGDSFASAEIREIHRDRIVINNAGRLEFIRLDESIQGNPYAGRTIDSVANKQVEAKKKQELVEIEQRKEKEAMVAKGGEENARDQGNKISIDRNELNTVLADPLAVAKQVSIAPHMRGGKPSGVRMVSVQGVFRRLGLQPGDVVRQINGRKVTSQASAMEALIQLKGASEVDLELDRGGRTQHFNYTLK